MEQAKQERQQKIVQAEGEAASATLVGQALTTNPGYLKLRKIRAAQNIARTVSFKVMCYGKIRPLYYILLNNYIVRDDVKI